MLGSSSATTTVGWSTHGIVTPIGILIMDLEVERYCRWRVTTYLDKILAAHRAGIKEVLIPARNERSGASSPSSTARRKGVPWK